MDSAPGLDCIPYKVFRACPSFFAHMIGKAFYILGNESLSIEGPLGPSHDLSIWIPKKEGADTAAG